MVNIRLSNNYPFEIFKKIDIQDAFPLAQKWLAAVRGLPGISVAEISGELRRGKPAITRIEIAAGSPHPDVTLQDLCRLPSDLYQCVQREDHVIYHLDGGVDLVIWVDHRQHFGSLLQRTTGSQAHQQWLSLKAALKGLRYASGLIWQGNQQKTFEDEKTLYGHLELPCIPPELREGIWEDEWLSSSKSHPLISEKDIIADLHVHTDWSDGKHSIPEMARAAIRHGLTLMAITDHSPASVGNRYQGHGYLFEEHAQIEKINDNFGRYPEILKGVEVDILPNGSLDLSDDVLARMDLVIASIHDGYDMPRYIITNRYLNAIRNPYVNIIGHPGGRLYPMDDICDLDWDHVISEASQYGVALEINAHKSQPIFDESKVRQAAEMGVLISMNSDAHHADMFTDARYGLFIARRAGLNPDQVINTWPKDRIKAWLRKKRRASAHGG